MTLEQQKQIEREFQDAKTPDEVYRNAGTGAFGYGNDLKYPIPAT